MRKTRLTTGSASSPAAAELPAAITFFVSADERRRILAALRRLHPTDRAAALLAACDAADATHGEPARTTRTNTGGTIQ